MLKTKKANKTFTTYDIVSVIIYLLLTVFVAYVSKTISCSLLAISTLTIYSIFTPIFIYFVNYKSLRNIWIYCIWIVFSIYHFILYLELKHIGCLSLPRGHSSDGLRFTIVYLLTWQILRIEHYKYTKTELVAPAYGSGHDFFGERQTRTPDYIAFVIYLFLYVLINIYNGME